MNNCPQPSSSRREFIAASAMLPVVLTGTQIAGSAPHAATESDSVFLDAGPMLGDVTTEHALIWVKSSSAATLSLRISEDAGMADARRFEGPQLRESSRFAGVAEAKHLKPGTRYYYVPLLDGKPAMSPPYPTFETPVTRAAKLRVAFGSCVGRTGAENAAAFGEMAVRLDFDLLLMLGDNHYADTTDLNTQRRFYLMHRKVAGFAHIGKQRPVYAIWDDHDFGPNNSDGTSQGKDDSLRAFREWWANPAYGEKDNPGIYFKFSRTGADFFMLDGRYHRSRNDAEDDGTKTMLGDKQKAWLKRELLASRAAFKIIACGSPFESHCRNHDAWYLFERERRELLDFIDSKKLTGVILLSGDRHFCAAYQVLGRFLEFCSGPFGSENATLPQDNPEQFSGHDEGRMWMVLELDPTTTPPNTTYEIWQAGGGRLERRALSWDEVNGLEAITSSKLPLRAARMEPK